MSISGYLPDIIYIHTVIQSMKDQRNEDVRGTYVIYIYLITKATNLVLTKQRLRMPGADYAHPLRILDYQDY